MLVSFLQYDIKFADAQTNLNKVKSLTNNLNTDLLVLPELAFSGYFMSSREEAFKLGNQYRAGECFEFISGLAAKNNCVVIYGFPEIAGDKLFNSCAAVLPDGTSYLYRKTHLFNLEKFWYDPGDTGFIVFDYLDTKIGLMICFDWIFPEAARTLMLKGAEIICHPSNLVLQFCQKAMITRCQENQLFAITCNRIGSETQKGTTLNFTGKSQIVGPKGDLLIATASVTEEVKTVVINPSDARLKQVTEHNEVLSDRRPQYYLNK